MATMPKPPVAAPEKKALTGVWGKVKKSGRRVGIYGEGGVGKSTLATKVNGRIAYLDLENTLDKLFGDEVPENVDAAYAADWETVLALLGQIGTEYKCLVIDSVTTAEVMIEEYVRYHFKPNKAGFGKVDFFEEKCEKPLHSLDELGGGGGANAKYQAFNSFLMRLDAIAAKSVNIILIAHDCSKDVDDLVNGSVYKHMEPRLSDPNSGKNSMRLRYKEWLDDLLYLFFERLVSGEDKHERRTGDRLVAVEAGDGYVAKSRTLHGDPVNLAEFDINTLIK